MCLLQCKSIRSCARLEDKENHHAENVKLIFLLNISQHCRMVLDGLGWNFSQTSESEVLYICQISKRSIYLPKKCWRQPDHNGGSPLSEVPASLWGPFFKWLPGKILALHSPIFDIPLTSAFINPDRILRRQKNNVIKIQEVGPCHLQKFSRIFLISICLQKLNIY